MREPTVLDNKCFALDQCIDTLKYVFNKLDAYTQEDEKTEELFRFAQNALTDALQKIKGE